MKVYVDTSFLVSLYSLDANSEAAVDTMRTSNTQHVISTLCELEVANAMQLRAYRKQSSVAQARASAEAFENDLRAGVFQLSPLTDQSLEKAKQLSLQFTAKLGTRTADLLHVAAALDLQATVLYSFDRQQRELARSVGLKLN